jgi:hypothetical protein
MGNMVTITCHQEPTDSVEQKLFVYKVEYHLEGVRVSSIECDSLTVCLHEIENKMKMDMAHLKGKVFTSPQGRY